MEITLVIGIISCVIGVSTFVSGMVTRGKTEGQTVEKINQCIKGIDEIKKELKESAMNYNNLHIFTVEQESRLKVCEEDIKSIFERLNKAGV